ncbi:DUF881 domain-containing protein [Alkalithermobacter paradoxus]|uniref:Division initiation protein n=1 Tax=Alkalithermobacter paradoxus TaxID=29349 RepID=A0A1V4IAG3_9FIRM|nr:hypothetical protein CLOTH_01420 [[Clostridium] thermoalcaliphilum]
MKQNKVIIFFLSILLGIIIMIQFKTIEKATGGVVSSQKSHQLAAELKSLRDRKEVLLRELRSVENRIEEYKNAEANESIVVKNLKNDIKKYENLAGYYDVSGPGIIVKLEEPKDSASSGILTYNYELLLALINKLNASGAEAISVNKERIIATTEIALSGENLLINGNPTIPPFEVRAIGDANTLEASLNLRYGIVWEIRTYYGINVSIEKNQNIQIPRYSKRINFRYAKPVEKL